MNASKAICATITATAACFEGTSAQEQSGDQIGLLLRWSHAGCDEPVDVIATGTHPAMSEVRPGDLVQMSGAARLVEALPYLKLTLLLRVQELQIALRARQSGEPA